MKKSIGSVLVACMFLIVLLSGCTPASVPTQSTSVPTTATSVASISNPNCASESTPPLNISDEEGTKETVYTTGKLPVTTAAGEEASLTITFIVFDSTNYSSGMWRLEPASSQHYMGRWSSEIVNDSFTEDRQAGEPSLVLTGQLKPGNKATGTLTLLDDTFEWEACALTTYPEVDPASSAGTVEGNVYSSSLAKGLPNITVNLSKQVSEEETELVGTTTTDENGYFRFENVDPNSYSLSVETDSASPFCHPSNPISFFVPSYLLPKAEVGFVLSGTTEDGRSIQSIGGILLEVKAGDIIYADIETSCY